MKQSKGEYRLKATPADIIPIACVLLSALIISLIISASRNGENGRIGVITQQGEVIYEIDLDNSPDRKIEIEGAYPCVITVENGEIGFTHSTCPGGDCVRSGMLCKSGETAACLPNGTVIRITGDDTDAVVG